MKIEINAVWEDGIQTLRDYPELQKYGAELDGDTLYIHIQSISDFIGLATMCQRGIILSTEGITIYDDWIE